MHHHRQALAVARALAPTPRRPRRACGKRWYADRIAADLALALIRSRGSARSKDPVRSYHCPTCNGWHLTAIPVWRAGPHVPRQQTLSPDQRVGSPVTTGPGRMSAPAAAAAVAGAPPIDDTFPSPRCPRSAL